jgi:2-polyprenyl-3-methyl-5-hydroxy-6-metoxy-1,4-benzoquinol methylase
MKKFARRIYRRVVNTNAIRTLKYGAKSRDELHAYWRQPPSGENQPEQYAQRTQRSEFLVEVVQRYLAPEKSILEIGSNVGRNLVYLHRAGYVVSGIEISSQAVQAMKMQYPETVNAVTIYNASVEHVMSGLGDGQFNLTFTMAVLMHIHPDSEWIFKEMVRVTSDFLITVEDEQAISERHFPRNYGKIFRSLNMEQLEEAICSDKGFRSPSVRLRVFKKL